MLTHEGMFFCSESMRDKSIACFTGDKLHAHFSHLGSLMRFQAKMLGSFLYLQSKPTLSGHFAVLMLGIKMSDTYAKA